jgi:double-stranded uracil-DNA glycosylase
VRLLRDILIPEPHLLLVGINPSIRSAEAGHHFASPGNPFWKLLYAARLVPVELTADKDARLVEFGLALTNLCQRATRSAAELTRDEMNRGAARLTRTVRRVRPRIVAFVGLSIYQHYFGKMASAGAGAKVESIVNARVFVLPNPSGLNASFPGFKDKLVWFERLRDEMRALERARR